MATCLIQVTSPPPAVDPFTRTVAVPATPSTVAVIVAPPAACADTPPVPSTEAMAAFDELQVTARPVSTFPAAS